MAIKCLNVAYMLQLVRQYTKYCFPRRLIGILTFGALATMLLLWRPVITEITLPQPISVCDVVWADRGPYIDGVLRKIAEIPDVLDEKVQRYDNNGAAVGFVGLKWHYSEASSGELSKGLGAILSSRFRRIRLEYVPNGNEIFFIVGAREGSFPLNVPPGSLIKYGGEEELNYGPPPALFVKIGTWEGCNIWVLACGGIVHNINNDGARTTFKIENYPQEISDYTSKSANELIIIDSLSNNVPLSELIKCLKALRTTGRQYLFLLVDQKHYILRKILK